MLPLLCVQSGQLASRRGFMQGDALDARGEQAQPGSPGDASDSSGHGITCYSPVSASKLHIIKGVHLLSLAASVVACSVLFSSHKEPGSR